MERNGGRSLDWAVALSIAVLAVVSRVIILRATHSTTEDFYITLRYAENLARGEGFVYNPGERVLGTTTPLYTLFLALVAWLGLDPTLLGKAVNILADGATCVLIVLLMAALGRPGTGWLAALLYATTSAPVNFSLGGMETGLVTLAGLSAIHAHARDRPMTMWLALAALFLLRIDGLLLAVMLGVGAFRRSGVEVLGSRISAGWRPVAPLNARTPQRLNAHLLGLVLAVLIVLPWLVFATLYFGSPIPTSLTAKLMVYQSTRAGMLPNLGEFVHQFLGGWPQRALFICFVAGAFAAWRAHRELRAPLVWLLVYYGAMLFSKVPAFGWYFVPPLPIYYALVALGFSVLGSRFSVLNRAIRNPESRIQNLLPILGLILLAAPLVWHLRSVARDIAEAQRLEDTVRKPLGLWLAQNSAPGERVMLEPIGYIGYFSQRPVLDIIGLVSPEVLPIYRQRAANPLGEIAARFTPTWLVLRREEWEELRQYRIAPGRSILHDYYFAARLSGPQNRSGVLCLPPEWGAIDVEGGYSPLVRESSL